MTLTEYAASRLVGHKSENDLVCVSSMSQSWSKRMVGGIGQKYRFSKILAAIQCGSLVPGNEVVWIILDQNNGTAPSFVRVPI